MTRAGPSLSRKGQEPGIEDNQNDFKSNISPVDNVSLNDLNQDESENPVLTPGIWYVSAYGYSDEDANFRIAAGWSSGLTEPENIIPVKLVIPKGETATYSLPIPAGTQSVAVGVRGIGTSARDQGDIDLVAKKDGNEVMSNTSGGSNITEYQTTESTPNLGGNWTFELEAFSAAHLPDQAYGILSIYYE